MFVLVSSVYFSSPAHCGAFTYHHHGPCTSTNTHTRIKKNSSKHICGKGKGHRARAKHRCATSVSFFGSRCMQRSNQEIRIFSRSKFTQPNADEGRGEAISLRAAPLPFSLSYRQGARNDPGHPSGHDRLVSNDLSAGHSFPPRRHGTEEEQIPDRRRSCQMMVCRKECSFSFVPFLPFLGDLLCSCCSRPSDPVTMVVGIAYEATGSQSAL